MPLVRELDPSAGPLEFFGAELRRARTAAGLSQEQLGQRVGYTGSQVGKVETGERAPSPDFAQRCDKALPEAGGLFTRIYALARRWDGGYPSWFAGWIEHERRATSLRTWEPLLIPGLLQTADYARALLSAGPDMAEDDQLEQLVSARIERQVILDGPQPPKLWVVIDETVLHRLIGTRKIMYDQLEALADTSCRSHVTIQVVPAGIGAHAGLNGAFIVAGFDGSPSILYVETVVEGQTIEKPALVSRATLAFDQLRAEALPRGASRDLIRKVAQERWTD
jgi:transcriptional regulator with XRE-family HTH domain